MNVDERWLHIAKLEADNRASKEKSEELKLAHNRKMQDINNISNAVAVAMSIFNPFLLLGVVTKEKNKK